MTSITDPARDPRLNTETAPEGLRTIPERQFDVQDERGRSYRVIRYLWQESEPSGWRDLFDLHLTETGGILDEQADGSFVVDGTGTVVRPVTGSERTREARDMDDVVPAGATGSH